MFSGGWGGSQLGEVVGVVRKGNSGSNDIRIREATASALDGGTLMKTRWGKGAYQLSSPTTSTSTKKSVVLKHCLWYSRINVQCSQCRLCRRWGYLWQLVVVGRVVKGVALTIIENSDSGTCSRG